MPPVFPGAAETRTEWKGAEGLAEDVRLYGEWMRDEAEKRIGHLYPKVKAPGGTEHTVIAWIWARTVRNPNPANPIEVPLVRSWWLAKKKGKEAWVEAKVVDGEVRYEVRHDANGPVGDADGTVKRNGAVSVADGTPISLDYIRDEGRAGRLGTQLIAIVGQDKRGRVYVSPSDEHELAARVERPSDLPPGEIAYNPRDFRTALYGLPEFSDLFTDRQAVALTQLDLLLAELREVIDDQLERLSDQASRRGYADGLILYLALAISKAADYNNSLCRWMPQPKNELVGSLFARQSIPMVWDYAEANILSGKSGSFASAYNPISRVLKRLPAKPPSTATMSDASTRSFEGVVISTDPPYYDNIGYSDLSDFFYIWLRKSLTDVYPEYVNTILTPKINELVADPYRHNGRDGAQQFFVNGFNSVFQRMRMDYSTDVPVTVYYAYKQQDVRDAGTASTGWHTLLEGLLNAGFQVTATWPMRSERTGRMVSVGTNALASSIVLACRPRPEDAPSTTRREFTRALKKELPDALRTMLQGSIAPVDLAQAAIGPGIAIYSRYLRVRDADGTDMGVREALMLINQVLDEVLGEQESDFDPETRFATRWFRSYGWNRESSGLADQLARSSDTSLGALERGGILQTGGGKARLLPPDEMSGEWNALTDDALSIWEATVRLAGVLQRDGADGAARMLVGVQQRVQLDAVKDLGFLLFHEAEKRSDSKTAGYFNALVTSWPDIVAMANEMAAQGPKAVQGEFDL